MVRWLLVLAGGTHGAAGRTEEHQQRPGVGQHADHRDGDQPDEVVHLEVVHVLSDAGGRLESGGGGGSVVALGRVRASSAQGNCTHVGAKDGDGEGASRTSAKFSGLAYAVRSSSSAQGRLCQGGEMRVRGGGCHEPQRQTNHLPGRPRTCDRSCVPTSLMRATAIPMPETARTGGVRYCAGCEWVQGAHLGSPPARRRRTSRLPSRSPRPLTAPA